MPTYQYACTTCDHRLEAVQSFTDAPLTRCPECEGRLRKLFSSVGIVFKGSGFYRTDSRAAANGGEGRKSEKSDQGSGSSAGAGDGAKSTPAASKDKVPASTGTAGTGTASPAAGK